MRQTLFYIPPEILGVPLFGVGLLFGVIGAVTILSMLRAIFWTKNRENFWSCLFVGAAASAMVVWAAPAIGGGYGFPIRGYGLFLMLAILAATCIALWRGKKRWNLSPEILLSVAIVQVIAGIFGARIFYVLEYWETLRADSTIQTVLNIVNLTQGGLVVFGSILGGIVASFVYLKWKKLPIFATLDIFAPALMLGIALGRLGCFMNGCCFGGVCDRPWAVTFPVGSPVHYHQMENGAVSLGGFTLEAPKTTGDAESADLFHFKSHGNLLRSGRLEPVVVASVDSDSEAQRAGLTAGARILRLGVLASLDPPPTPEEIRRAATIPVRCNDDVFLTFYQTDAIHTRWIFVLDVLPADQTDMNQTERVAFHLGPFRVLPVHPTQLYSAAAALALFVLLMFLDRFCRRDGTLFVLMLIFYSSARFSLELIRTDEASYLGTGLSVAQCVSVLIFGLAAVLGIFILRQPPQRAFESWKAK